MFSKIAIGSLSMACVMVAASASFAAIPAITLGVGSTSLVLSSAQATVGVAALAGLAIAKEALILASNSRRGRRDVSSTVDFTDMFESVDAKDPADCAKLLVCESFAKPDTEINGEERAVHGLFDDLSVIQPNAFGKFQLAAYMGLSKDASVCKQAYDKCPISVSALSNLLNVQQ